MASRYIALIPAYEPDRKMLGIIADLGNKGCDIVLVDDGSGPEYSELFEQAAESLPDRSGTGVHGVTLLIHNENRGKGAALRTGLDHINNFMVDRGGEVQTVIVTVDADGQHLAKDVIWTAEAAGSMPGTLVLGCRDFGTDVPLRSRLGNTLTRKVFRLVTGASIYDTQTGLRAFTADLIPALLASRGDRYEYEINMLMDCIAKGIPVAEVGIETVYHDGNEGSHFNAVRDSFRIYREIVTQALMFSASSLVSFLIDYAIYVLLLFSGAGLVFANVGARAVSSLANYTINRKLVFRSGKSIATSALQYFALAACILAGNTCVLTVLTGTLGIGSLTAKIMTEIIFFIISWTVQKYVVFYSDDTSAGSDVPKRGAAAQIVPKDL